MPFQNCVYNERTLSFRTLTKSFFGPAYATSRKVELYDDNMFFCMWIIRYNYNICYQLFVTVAFYFWSSSFESNESGFLGKPNCSYKCIYILRVWYHHSHEMFLLGSDLTEIPLSFTATSIFRRCCILVSSNDLFISDLPSLTLTLIFAAANTTPSQLPAATR